MTIATINDPILAKSRGSIQQVQDYIAPHNPQRLDFVNAYLTALWTLCNAAGVDFLLAASQAVEETEFFTSSWFVQRGNVAGMGITGDATQDAASPTFPTGAVAAKAQVSHLVLYATGAVALGGLTPADDPRHDAYVAAYGAQPIARTIGALSGRWAADAQYGVQITSHANGILAMPIKIPASTGGGTMSKQWIAGLAAPIELSFPVVQDIIPISIYNRPGRKLSGRRRFIIHETDNTSPGADALMHGRWLRNGPVDRNGNREYIGVHFFVDKTGARQCIPIDEVSYQAADGPGPGNESCISIEICVPRDGDYNAAMKIAEELFGKLAAPCNVIVPDDIGLHYDYNSPEHLAEEGLPPDPDRHHCPDIMLKTNRVAEFKAGVVSFAKTPVVPPTPTPKPAPVPGFKPPAGMSLQLLERLYTGSPDNKLVIGGQAVSFDPNDEVSRAWLTRCIASIPHGKPWRDGSWPPIKDRIHRGPNGRDGADYLLGDGHVIHADAHGHVAA